MPASSALAASAPGLAALLENASKLMLLVQSCADGDVRVADAAAAMEEALRRLAPTAPDLAA